MSRRWIVNAVWPLYAFTVALIAGAVGLVIANGATRQELDYLPFVVACATVSSLIATRHPDNPVGWLLAVGALCFALMAFTAHYALYGLVTEPGSLPGARALTWPQTWLWAPGAAAVFLLLPLYFPNGRLLTPRWRMGARMVILAGIATAIIAAVTPGQETIQVQADNGAIVNPLGLDRVGAIFPDAESTLGAVMPVLSFATLCIVAAGLVVRYRRSHGIERQQMKWLTYVIAGFPIFVVVSMLYKPLGLAGGMLLISIPVAVGIAILKYDIDIIINRTLVYGTLTAMVIGVYVLVVGYFGARLQTDSNLVVSLAATGIVTVRRSSARQSPRGLCTTSPPRRHPRGSICFPSSPSASMRFWR